MCEVNCETEEAALSSAVQEEDWFEDKMRAGIESKNGRRSRTRDGSRGQTGSAEPVSPRWMRLKFALAAACVLSARALPQAETSTSTSGTSTVTSSATVSEPISTAPATETTAVSTAVPSPTAPLDSPLPSQAALPPKQAWCPSEIFCAGQLLQSVNLAKLYVDSKTFVDKPTAFDAQRVLSDFNALGPQDNVTVGAIANFVSNDFRGEGLELEALTLSNFPENPTFLSKIKDPLVKAWSKIVHTYWSDLIRGTNPETLCSDRNGTTGCESSLIPLNHTFVVPGGRFREQYYWDSYWIVRGLLESQLYDIVNSTLQNFMDELDTIGFIPNGGRIYYLNRSQPPLFIHMLAAYVNRTKDTDILDRALPLAEKELAWWANNRTFKVESPTEKDIHPNGEDIETPLTDEQKADLYAELATGAESGWDYTARWSRQQFSGNLSNTEPQLRSLNLRALVPVDLNAILYGAHIQLASLFDRHTKSKRDLQGYIGSLLERAKACLLRFQYNRGWTVEHFHSGGVLSLWMGIWPESLLKSETKTFGAFSSVNYVLNMYNGTYPATFLETGLQWDFPNSWPPHVYIILEALNNIPKKLNKQKLPQINSTVTSFDLVPEGQLGLSEDQLPKQTLDLGGYAATDINAGNNTVINGGTPAKNEKWRDSMTRQLANRYVSAAFCSWYSTGGSIPGLLQQLSPEELNATNSDPSSEGHMFEKFSAVDVDQAGSGGEYTVQAGFGWTNGVALWIGAKYGAILSSPTCPAIIVQNTTQPDGTALFVGHRKQAWEW
ncbi:Trehalase [Rhizoctonia solani]|uniref:Trehalase n=1 Tax=Rhizoctonia solani TaxID=456999 RepID=A0A8H7I2J3_9AGAM|nr:Trehalase [Rhizoctonia solani]